MSERKPAKSGTRQTPEAATASQETHTQQQATDPTIAVSTGNGAPHAAPISPWVALIRAMRDVMLRLIDRGHIATFLMLAVVCLLALVVYRMPPNDLGGVPRLLVDFLNGGWLAAAFGIETIALTVFAPSVFMMRKTYKTEIARISRQKAALEKRLDPSRKSHVTRKTDGGDEDD